MENTPLDRFTTIRLNILSAIMILLWVALEIKEGIPYSEYGLVNLMRTWAIVGSVICMLVAQRKNRNPVVWFAVGLWFALIGIIVILCLKKVYIEKCPYCLRGIEANSTVCPYCQNFILIPKSNSNRVVEE